MLIKQSSGWTITLSLKACAPFLYTCTVVPYKPWFYFCPGVLKYRLIGEIMKNRKNSNPCFSTAHKFSTAALQKKYWKTGIHVQTLVIFLPRSSAGPPHGRNIEKQDLFWRSLFWGDIHKKRYSSNNWKNYIVLFFVLYYVIFILRLNT